MLQQIMLLTTKEQGALTIGDREKGTDRKNNEWLNWKWRQREAEIRFGNIYRRHNSHKKAENFHKIKRGAITKEMLKTN